MTSFGSVSASGGSPFTPGLPNVISTLPSGLNLMTTLPFLSSPGNLMRSSAVGTRASVTHTFPSRSTWMPCPHEHPAAKAPDLLARLVEEMDRVCLGAEAARGNSWRATVRRPNGLAVPVDGYTVGTAPRPFLQRELCPIADDAIGIGSAVDGLNFVGLGGSATLLSLNAGALGGDGDDDRHRALESHDN